MINKWSDVSIKKWKEIQSIARNDKPYDENIYEYIAVCADIPLEEVMTQPYEKTLEMAKNIQFIHKAPQPAMIRRWYFLEGGRYRTLMNPMNMTTAQYIDFQTYGKDTDKNLKEVLSIFLIPEGKKYGEYDITAAQKDIEENISIEEALGLAVFFITLFKLLIRQILRRYRREKTEGEEKELMDKVIMSLQMLYKSLDGYRA